MTACLWAGSANPRVLSGRHEPDCPGDCKGCQHETCGIMSEAAGCVNTERPLTHSSDLSREGLAVKATPDAKVCTVEGCEKATLSRRRMCEMHYYRMRKHGSFELPQRDFIKDKPCAAEGCTTEAKTKGYCGKHWERIRKHGDPGQVLVILDDPIKRFLSYVEKTETCWLWTGDLTYDGYGIFGVDGQRTGAHRWSYTFFVGSIPPGLHIDHVWDRGCRHRHCVNPDHLEAVTPAENSRRGWDVYKRKKAGLA